MKPESDRWDAKRRWHEEQWQQTPADKIRLIIQLQQREVLLDRARAAAGQPTRGLKPWRTQA